MTIFPPLTRGHAQRNRLVTAPSIEPVYLDELREHLRNPPEAENGLLLDCITQARQLFEAHTGIACIAQSWRLTLDAWPTEKQPLEYSYTMQPVLQPLAGTPPVELPKWPPSSVTSITTYSSTDVGTAITVADYFYLDTAARPGALRLKEGALWPTLGRYYNAVEIVYVAGFGSLPTDVPETLRRAIKQLAATLYTQRGDGCEPSSMLKSSGALQIAAEYVRVRV